MCRAFPAVLVIVAVLSGVLGSSAQRTTADTYLLIRGAFVVAGKQPDGDSVRFIPDQPELFQGLKRASRIQLARTDGSVQLRFEVIDAPELHYENLAQPFSKEPRDALLAWLGFQSVTYSNGGIVARSSTPTRVRGAILSTAAEVYGRPISFVFKEPDIAGADGTRLEPDAALLRRSANAFLLESGMAYLTVYSSLETSQRALFRSIASTARGAGRGVWALDRTADFDLANLERVTREQLILPKLFRRAVTYFEDVNRGFRGTLLDWFAANPSRDDAVLVGERGTTLARVLEMRGSRMRLLVDQLDLVVIEQ
jgi:endonuclease YncB( thermonuclease family)